jgi:hypothetical protein
MQPIITAQLNTNRRTAMILRSFRGIGFVPVQEVGGESIHTHYRPRGKLSREKTSVCGANGFRKFGLNDTVGA